MNLKMKKIKFLIYFILFNWLCQIVKVNAFASSTGENSFNLYLKSSMYGSVRYYDLVDFILQGSDALDYSDSEVEDWLKLRPNVVMLFGAETSRSRRFILNYLNQVRLQYVNASGVHQNDKAVWILKATNQSESLPGDFSLPSDDRYQY